MSEAPSPLIRGGRFLLLTLVGVAAVLLLGRGASAFLVEILWYRGAGYESVFWTRVFWGWGLRLAVFVLTTFLVARTLRRVGETLGGIQIRRRFGDLEIQEQLPEVYIRWTVLGMGVLMGLWIGATVPLEGGVGALLVLRAPEWGIRDPILSRDLSFYVFLLPALVRVLAFGILLSFLLLSLAAAGYVSTGALRVVRGKLSLQREARVHLSTLTAVFLLLLAVRFWLARYLLLLDGNSAVEGIFGFADAQARIPAYQFLTAVGVASAAAVFWGGRKARNGLMLAGVAGFVLAGVVVGQLYPSFVQRFQVEPNELRRETPYIEHALEFTRLGFGLHELDRQEFDYRPPTVADWARAPSQMAGLPVWTADALGGTLEVEARFLYYDFKGVAVDRYPGPGGPVPVAIAAREVDPTGIDDPNWQNLHLRERYLAGVGAVVTSATAVNPQGRVEMFLRSIPPETELGEQVPEGLALTRPSTFFGIGPQTYAILNPTPSAFLAPDGSPGIPGVDYPSGISIGSTLTKLALAWRFRDANLLFSSELGPESRFIFRRRLGERVRALAPFLRFVDSEAYPVIHEGRIVWMMDGFTATRHFPLSAAHEFTARRQVTYVRGAVKATVDGVTGQVRFYAVDPEDPLLQAYSDVFPGLIQPLGEMPETLLRHIRYPRSLLGIQSRVLTRYHLETAPLFHGQQDVWSLAQELSRGTRPGPYQPEYGIYSLPGSDEPEFLLTTVFVPAGRQNLTGVLIARSDPERYGELALFDVQVEDQVLGPRQVEALVEQDPAISQQFSLWRQGGSEVWSGHLHLIPVGRTLLYMEPIFLAAEADAIPELRRFIVSDGRRVAMTPTLTEAILTLAPGGAVDLAALAAEGGEGTPPEVPPGITPPGTGEGSTWSREALELLNEAEARLRQGDWVGFGAALERLRAYLEEQSGAGIP